MNQIMRPILALAFVFLMASCSTCSDKIEAELVSPDNALKATWFTRDCGATTEFSTIVSVHRPDNTYKDDGDIVFVAKGRGELKLNWSGPRQLRIQCNACQRKDIFKQTAVLGDVDISY